MGLCLAVAAEAAPIYGRCSHWASSTPQKRQVYLAGYFDALGWHKVEPTNVPDLSLGQLVRQLDRICTDPYYDRIQIAAVIWVTAKLSNGELKAEGALSMLKQLREQALK